MNPKDYLKPLRKKFDGIIVKGFDGRYVLNIHDVKTEKDFKKIKVETKGNKFEVNWDKALSIVYIRVKGDLWWMKNSKDKYILEDGVYYMISNGKKIPVDIDAPPMFRADLNEIKKDEYLKVLKEINKESLMNKYRVSEIADEIFKEAALRVEAPTKSQSRGILRALRSHFGIEAVEKPIWRKYLTFRDKKSNKFHYFVVFQIGDKFVAANAYARIDYKPKVVDLGEYDNKAKAMKVVENKMRIKLRDGYKPTLLR